MTGGPRRPVFLSAVAVLALAGCGGRSLTSPAPPGELSPPATAKWNQYCAHWDACHPSDSSPCSTTSCMARIAEEGPLIEFVDCQLAKTCEVNDDDCVASAGTTDAEREAFTARCEARLSVRPEPPCSLGWPDLAVCTIVAYPLVRKEHMRAVDACLTLPCEDLKACFEAALEPLSCA